jgi:hypothetical protein
LRGSSSRDIPASKWETGAKGRPITSRARYGDYGGNMDGMSVGPSVWGVGFALLLAACGGDETLQELEPLGSAEQHWGVTSCSTASANEVDTESLNSLASAGYDNCYRSYVLDLQNTDASSSHFIFWKGAQPMTQSACEGIWLGVIRYERMGEAWSYLDTQKVFGRWFSSSCELPTVAWGSSELVQGRTYRFAVTARQFPNGTNTHPVQFSSFEGTAGSEG